MQFDDVAVGHGVVPSDVLPVESGRPPDPRVPQRAGEVLVHEPRDVLHGLSPAKGERVVAVWWTAGYLRVDAQNAEMGEEPGADLPEAQPRARRHGERGIAQAGELKERPQLAGRIGKAVGLVGEEQRGKAQREGILVDFRGRAAKTRQSAPTDG